MLTDDEGQIWVCPPNLTLKEIRINGEVVTDCFTITQSDKYLILKAIPKRSELKDPP